MSQQIQVTITFDPHQYVGGQVTLERTIDERPSEETVITGWGMITAIRYSYDPAVEGIYVVADQFFSKVNDDPWSTPGTEILILRQEGDWKFLTQRVLDYQCIHPRNRTITDKITLYPPTAELLYDVDALMQEAAANG